jgi:hypothetical protein
MRVTFADGDELLVAPDIFVIDVIIHCVQWLGSVVREVHYWWSCAGNASLIVGQGRKCETAPLSHKASINDLQPNCLVAVLS